MTQKLIDDAMAFLQKVEGEARTLGQKEGYDKCKSEMMEAPDVLEPTDTVICPDGTEYTNTAVRVVASFSYSRKFATDKWGTLMLPISMDYEDWKGRFEIAEIVGVDVVGTKIVPRRSVLGEGSKTLPNHPYLIRAIKADATKEQTVVSKKGQIYPAIAGCVEVGKYAFKGSYVTMSAKDLSGKYYSSGGAFVKATSILKPMRVYLEIK